MQLEFRQASPSDAEMAVPLIYSAASEVFDYIFLHHKAKQFLHFTFQSKKGLFGCDNHLVAISSGAVVGIGAFYSGREYTRLALAHSKSVMSFYGLKKCWSVIKRSLQFRFFLTPPGRNEEYIANLGVSEKLRGKGIGTELILQAKERAIKKGKKTYSLDVAVNNPQAEKLYSRLGFSVTGEKSFKFKGKSNPIPNVRRMVMEL